MKNIDLINSEILNFPFNRNGEDYYVSIKLLFNQYIEVIKSFDGSIRDKIKSHISIIEAEIQLILEAIQLYHIGRISSAFTKLTECLDLLNSKAFLETGYIKGDFYRIRIGENKNFTKANLFHIPFQLREKVTSQRYSIPGLPCLYMADSLYTAWEEMDRPDFSKIHVVRFHFNDEEEKYKLLFLNTTTQEIRNRCLVSGKIKRENILIKYLTYWPLFASCSYEVYNKNDSFKPEYIIPQMVLQWVIENQGIDGVQFKSNRVKFNSENIGSFNNVAIPVKENKEKGYCSHLSNNILYTAPLSWSLLDISNPGKHVSDDGGDINVSAIRTASYIELINGEKSDYFSTKFGIMESKLKKMQIDKILQ